MKIGIDHSVTADSGRDPRTDERLSLDYFYGNGGYLLI